MKKTPMTELGAERLREELQRLKTVDRPRIINAIAEARAHGDLKENAEYHAAREQQSFAEGRIAEIEGKLSNVQIIDVTQFPNNGKVIFGSTVDLISLPDEKAVKYKIVGEDEADINAAKISFSSPIARAMVGKEVGDTIEVQTPDGVMQYEIVAVAYL